MSKSSNTKAQVAIIMGSTSDWPCMKEASLALKEFKIPFLCEVVSAHRTPTKLKLFCENARKNGIKVIIAGAGGAAHLPGMAAAFSELPVIGVPVPIGSLNGLDALLSIAQMPKGVPVACVAIGNGWNAGLLAAQMLGDNTTLDKIKKYKKSLEKKVLRAKIK